MLLPLFLTCDTLDFSHTVGSVNSPWNAVFVYERYLHGLGFTEKAYERMHEIMPVVLKNVRECSCAQGCPCCVGKPLRQFTTWNVERGEASIPSKASALMILEGLFGDGTALDQEDQGALTDSDAAAELRLEKALQRRLERMREPQVFHPITPPPEVRTAYPGTEPPEELSAADVAKRAERRRGFEKDLHKRIAKHIGLDGLAPHKGKGAVPKGMKTRQSNLRPVDFAGKPGGEGPRAKSEARRTESKAETPSAGNGVGRGEAMAAGDKLAARARRMYKKRADSGNQKGK